MKTRNSSLCDHLLLAITSPSLATRSLIRYIKEADRRMEEWIGKIFTNYENGKDKVIE
ncbi:MAG: hypothetical protein WD267_02245 [Balneolales bacterium]